MCMGKRRVFNLCQGLGHHQGLDFPSHPPFVWWMSSGNIDIWFFKVETIGLCTGNGNWYGAKRIAPSTGEVFVCFGMRVWSFMWCLCRPILHQSRWNSACVCVWSWLKHCDADKFATDACATDAYVIFILTPMYPNNVQLGRLLIMQKKIKKKCQYFLLQVQFVLVWSHKTQLWLWPIHLGSRTYAASAARSLVQFILNRPPALLHSGGCSSVRSALHY